MARFWQGHRRVAVARGALAAFLAVLASSAAVRGQTIQTGAIGGQLKLVTTVTTSTNGAPNFGVHAGDSRFLYVGEQNGAIRTLDFTQPNPLLGTSFLNVDSVLGADANGRRVLVDDTGGGERGLLGAAFHPDFNNPANPNGYRKFYTYTSETLASGTPHFFHQTETAADHSNLNDPVQGMPAGFPDLPNGYNHQSVIREWTAGAPNAQGVTTINTAVPSRVVMRMAKPGRFHNGGGITFGGDGYLYIPIGDGGGGGSNGAHDGGNNSNNQGHTNPGNPDAPGSWTGQGNAQDRRNPYGKILRIKPTTDADVNTNPNTVGGGYRVPKSNPFTLDTNPATPANFVDEIFAYGFRNPFRISFDKANPTQLYAADVGQDRNSFSREEISKITPGGNYGWVGKSGDQTSTVSTYPLPAGLIDPIAQYETTQLGHGGLAVIGGFIYEGDDIPALIGKYVFGDLNRGNGTGARLLYTDFADPALTVYDLAITGSVAKPTANLHGVAEGADGEIYFLFSNGQVMALVPEPGAIALLSIAAVAVGMRRRRPRSR